MEQRELEGGRRTLERKWRIILHARSNADPTRAGAETIGAVKQGELEEATPLKEVMQHLETRRRQ